MSVRTEPCSEFVLPTTTLSLSYALRILFLYLGCYMCLRDWRLLAQPFHFLFNPCEIEVLANCYQLADVQTIGEGY